MNNNYTAPDPSTCTICGGEGYRSLDKNNRDYKTPCACTLRYLYYKSLGSAMYHATKIDDSVLENHLGKDVFIKGNRRDVLPHLRITLIKQGTGFFHRVTNDSELIDAWLSKDKESSKNAGSTGITYTSLRDLVEDPTLLIIFLGVLSYSNRALPGVLLEALRIREHAGKPTWIIATHKTPFKPGHFAYSPETEEFFNTSCEVVDFPATQATRHIYAGTQEASSYAEGQTPEETKLAKRIRMQNATRGILNK